MALTVGLLAAERPSIADGINCIRAHPADGRRSQSWVVPPPNSVAITSNVGEATGWGCFESSCSALCALFDTLIADADGVYDPANDHDRLLLGLTLMSAAG